jgi:predicted NAD-dependent protein-ADP-ribosyltransferase YbiA (DUF1768 family)
MGREVRVLRPGWDTLRVVFMRDLVRQKFEDHALATMLDATGVRQLVEGNTWGDTFWGVSGGRGRNMLGEILMEVRALNAIRFRPWT